MNYGTLPTLEQIENSTHDWEESYDMEFHPSSDDYNIICDHTGYIDSYLQIINLDWGESINGRIWISIFDAVSLRILIRRLIETGSDETLDFASSILYTLDIEWV